MIITSSIRSFTVPQGYKIDITRPHTSKATTSPKATVSWYKRFGIESASII